MAPGRVNTDEARGIWGVSCYQIATGFISYCSRDPVTPLPVEWGAVLRIQKAAVNVMEFPAAREAFLELEG